MRRVPRTDRHQRRRILHPVAFIAIIAGAKIDAIDPVNVKGVTEKRVGQERARRQRIMRRDMRQFLDMRDAARRDPVLRGDRNTIDPCDAKAQAALFAIQPRPCAQKIRVAFGGFPALAVYRLKIIPIAVGRLVGDGQFHRALFGFALDGGAQDARTRGPPIVKIASPSVDPMVLAGRIHRHLPPRLGERALQMFGGRGVRVGEVVEHLYRDIRSLRIYEGASEVQLLILGKNALR